MQLGLDFTGGLQVEASFTEEQQVETLRDGLANYGVTDAKVVYFGSTSIVKMTTQLDSQALAQRLLSRLSGLAAEHFSIDAVAINVNDALPSGGMIISLQSDQQRQDQLNKVFADIGFNAYRTKTEGNITSILSAKDPKALSELLLVNALQLITKTDVTLNGSEFVGPQIGKELRDQGGLGLLCALLVVMVYIALRFQFKFSVGAVAALVHDVIIVVGLFSIFHLDFDLTVLAAVLAVIGYSLNDTIVVSDRIRENFRKVRKGTPIQIINQSLTQTLGRTLVTSLTTLLVLLALFFVGGELINSFALALIIGILVGTYSSIYVAANTLLLMNITKEDLMLPEKEKTNENAVEMP